MNTSVPCVWSQTRVDNDELAPCLVHLLSEGVSDKLKNHAYTIAWQAHCSIQHPCSRPCTAIQKQATPTCIRPRPEANTRKHTQTLTDKHARTCPLRPPLSVLEGGDKGDANAWAPWSSPRTLWASGRQGCKYNSPMRNGIHAASRAAQQPWTMLLR
jgi:hypothetical protein